jgi:uncharacterized membrane protein
MEDRMKCVQAISLLISSLYVTLVLAYPIETSWAFLLVCALFTAAIIMLLNNLSKKIALDFGLGKNLEEIVLPAGMLAFMVILAEALLLPEQLVINGNVITWSGRMTLYGALSAARDALLVSVSILIYRGLIALGLLHRKAKSLSQAAGSVSEETEEHDV